MFHFQQQYQSRFQEPEQDESSNVTIWCNSCGLDFFSWDDFDEHKLDTRYHFWCQLHNEDCDSWNDLVDHFLDWPDHFYCEDHNAHFDDHQQLCDHFEYEHVLCQPCNISFPDGRALNDHLQNDGRHFFCFQCRKDFPSRRKLMQHKRGPAHKPRNVHCPYCPKRFLDVTGMTNHLESGSCTSGSNRHSVNRHVRRVDTSNLITNPARFIGGADWEPETIYATELAWNGWDRAYECYYCHKQYRHLKDLNQHLASPVHDSKIYICRNRNCRYECSALSTLIRHFESGSCGVAMFQQEVEGRQRRTIEREDEIRARSDNRQLVVQRHRHVQSPQQVAQDLYNQAMELQEQSRAIMNNLGMALSFYS